jgi:predicted nucleic acid-binding protein
MIMLDTNVVIYFLEPGSVHHDWAIGAVEIAIDSGEVGVSTIVLAELSSLPREQEEITEIVQALQLKVVDFDRSSAVLAGHAHACYRAAGGSREMLLGDFLVGGHALAASADLMTSDPRRYRRYFPDLTLITPET